jgi:hypothetical protein
MYPILTPSAFELVLETWPAAPAVVLVETEEVDVWFDVEVLIRPPGFAVGVGDYSRQLRSILGEPFVATPFVTVTVPRPVNPIPPAVAATVVVLATPTSVARFEAVHKPGTQKAKSELSWGNALEQPATALSYMVGA